MWWPCFILWMRWIKDLRILRKILLFHWLLCTLFSIEIYWQSFMLSIWFYLIWSFLTFERLFIYYLFVKIERVVLRFILTRSFTHFLAFFIWFYQIEIFYLFLFFIIISGRFDFNLINQKKFISIIILVAYYFSGMLW